MQKKSISFLIMLCLISSILIAGCTSNTSEETQNEYPAPPTLPDSGNELVDSNQNDLTDETIDSQGGQNEYSKPPALPE